MVDTLNSLNKEPENKPRNTKMAIVWGVMLALVLIVTVALPSGDSTTPSVGWGLAAGTKRVPKKPRPMSPTWPSCSR